MIDAQGVRRATPCLTGQKALRMPQDVFLFFWTVRENTSLGDRRITADEAVAVAWVGWRHEVRVGVWG